MPNCNKLECFTAIHVHLSLILGGKVGAWHSGLHSNGRLLALPTNIRLGWKWMEEANTLAYYYTARITAIIGFIVQAPGTNVINNIFFIAYG